MQCLAFLSPESRLFGVLPFLLAEMSFDLMPEEEHSQLAMRGLVHGLGLHAHSVLIWRQLVGAMLLVPQVEEAAWWRSDDQEVAVEVLSVEVDVFAAPAFDVNVKTSWQNRHGHQKTCQCVMLNMLRHGSQLWCHIHFLKKKKKILEKRLQFFIERFVS